jgi:preprotein translocase subunit SecY
LRFRRFAEYSDATACSECGGRLVDGERPSDRATPARPIGGDLWKRVGITVAALVGAYLLRFVALPGAALVRTDGGFLGLFNIGLDRSAISIAALWINPFLSGFGLVELVALCVPRWRGLRHAGPDARWKLTRAALVVSGILGLIQGFFVGQWMLARIPWTAPSLSIPFYPQVIAVTLTATMFGLYALAQLIDRRGIGNGLALLTASALVPLVIDSALDTWFRLSQGDISIVDVALRLAAVAVVAIATWGATRLRREVRTGERHFVLRLPTAGLAPMVLAASLLMLPAQLGGIFYPSTFFSPITNALIPGSSLYSWTNLILVAILTFLLSLAFHRPRAIAGLLARRPGPPLAGEELAEWSRGPLTASILFSVLFLGAVITVGDWLARRDHFMAQPILLVIGTTVILDLAAEWRARRSDEAWVAVWPLHRVWAVDVAIEALAEHGIACHARALRFRSMWHFFAPHVPIDLLVPSARAEEATRILTGLFVDNPPAPAASEVVVPMKA